MAVPPKPFAGNDNYLTGPLIGSPTKIQPPDATVAEGFVPSVPFGAQHSNWLLNSIIEAQRQDFQSRVLDLNQLVMPVPGSFQDSLTNGFMSGEVAALTLPHGRGNLLYVGHEANPVIVRPGGGSARFDGSFLPKLTSPSVVSSNRMVSLRFQGSHYASAIVGPAALSATSGDAMWSDQTTFLNSATSNTFGTPLWTVAFFDRFAFTNGDGMVVFANFGLGGPNLVLANNPPFAPDTSDNAFGRSCFFESSGGTMVIATLSTNSADSNHHVCFASSANAHNTVMPAHATPNPLNADQCVGGYNRGRGFWFQMVTSRQIEIQTFTILGAFTPLTTLDIDSEALPMNTGQFGRSMRMLDLGGDVMVLMANTDATAGSFAVYCWLSSDGGDTWSDVPTLLPGRVNNYSFTEDGRLFYVEEAHGAVPSGDTAPEYPILASTGL